MVIDKLGLRNKSELIVFGEIHNYSIDPGALLSIRLGLS